MCLLFFCTFQSEIGFGKSETYTKLDKLGEVCIHNLYLLVVAENHDGMAILKDEKLKMCSYRSKISSTFEFKSTNYLYVFYLFLH